jgi:nitrite reductase (NO-forming)
MFGPSIRAGVGIARSADRRIAFGGLVVAALYVALAAASLLLPPSIRLGSWLPAHLILAGAATTAIASILPFFTAALVVAPPAHPAVRIGGIGLVATGAIVVMTAYGHAAGRPGPALLGSGAFLAGLGLVAVATFLPIRGALGPRRTFFQRAYALALANVAVGATVATFVVGGNVLVGGAWGSLKPAHAWLNLVGFAGLVIVTTLLHLAPTIVGTRLRPRVSGRLAVVGVALGAPLVAAGYAAGFDLVARAGAVAAMVGALGVAAHGLAIYLDGDRGRWTTDLGWHRFTSLALLAGQAWLGFGLAVAAARVLASGANPAGWSLPVLLGPLVIGGVTQVLVAAMTHLLPAIGPGDPIRHAAQRRLLGQAATLRLAAINAGAAFVTVGFGPAAVPGAGAGNPGGALVGLGLACAAAGIGSSIVLFALATRPGAPTRVAAYTGSGSVTGRG